MSAFFSIVTVNRNNAIGMAQTISSVASQIFKDYEFIVIDGDSDDHSLALIQTASVITYFKSEPDQGIFDAMNKGIKVAQGKYLIMLNSGDSLANNEILAKTHDYIMRNSEYDIYFGNAIYVLNNAVLQWKWPYRSDIDFARWLQDYHPWHQATFIKKTIYENLTYDIDVKYSADAKFFTLAKKFARFKYLPLDICLFELEGVGSSSKSLKVNFFKATEAIAIKGKNSITILHQYSSAIINYSLRKLAGKKLFYYLMKGNQARRIKKYLMKL